MEDYQGLGNQKRGRRGEQVLDQRMHTESIILSNRKVIADSNSPTIPEYSNIPLGRISQTPIPHHHNTHAKSTHTSLQIHLHVSLTLNSLLWLPFEEESPVGWTLNAQSVTLQGITPVWVPPWSSGPTAPSCRSRVTNIIRTCYRHFYPVRQWTQLTSRYLT